MQFGQAGRYWRQLALAAALSALPLTAQADISLIDNWYAALAAADQDKLTAMLSDDAKIRLLDLDVVQSKAEFVASLDEWDKAASGVAIKHKVVATDGNVTTILACYDFPRNEVLMSETFKVNSNLITENVERVVAESCDGY